MVYKSRIFYIIFISLKLKKDLILIINIKYILFSVQFAVGLICFVTGEICLLAHSHLQLVALLQCLYTWLEFDFIACFAAVFGIVSLICRSLRQGAFCLINFYMRLGSSAPRLTLILMRTLEGL